MQNTEQKNEALIGGSELNARLCAGPFPTREDAEAWMPRGNANYSVVHTYGRDADGYLNTEICEYFVEYTEGGDGRIFGYSFSEILNKQQGA